MGDVHDEKLAKLIGYNITRQLTKKEKSQKELCEALGLSSSTVSAWVNGTRTPKPNKLDMLCEYFGCERDDLTTDEKEVRKRHSISIPVYARVAAGLPLEASEEIIDREEIPEHWAEFGDFYGLRICGNSMEPRIVKGDVVIVRKQEDADDGDIVIAIVNGNDAVCKRLKKYAGGIALVSSNPAYEPMYFTLSDTQDIPVRIIGRVVEIRGKL